jgi:hypothetical protein
MKHDLYEVDKGKLSLYFHPGQLRAWDSQKRFVTVLAGAQGGKTSFGPIWLWREMQRCGPGNYLVVTPTFTLLDKQALPMLRRWFETTLQLGKYFSGPTRRLEISDTGARRLFGPDYSPSIETVIHFGYGRDPDTLESITAKAAWLDEAGQKKFLLGSWEAVNRRLMINEGRILLTTTPYYLGWLKQLVWDRFEGGDVDYDGIRFDSIENPAFPRQEFERASLDMPKWKFNLVHKALWTRPAGLIYDSFSAREDKVPPFKVPANWPRFLGLDFGGVNTVGLFYAREPGTKTLYLYREYKAGGRTAGEHVRYLLDGEPQIPTCVGGSKSEGQWRQEFAAGGLPIREPDVKEVEIGIDRVYGAHKRHEIKVFSSCVGYLDEKEAYSREVDDQGNVLPGIDNKSSFHHMDAERYIVGWLNPSTPSWQATHFPF